MANEKPTNQLRLTVTDAGPVIERLWITTVNYRSPMDGEWDWDYDWEWRFDSIPACTVPSPLL